MLSSRRITSNRGLDRAELAHLHGRCCRVALCFAVGLSRSEFFSWSLSTAFELPAMQVATFVQHCCGKAGGERAGSLRCALDTMGGSCLSWSSHRRKFGSPPTKRSNRGAVRKSYRTIHYCTETAGPNTRRLEYLRSLHFDLYCAPSRFGALVIMLVWSMAVIALGIGTGDGSDARKVNPHGNSLSDLFAQLSDTIRKFF
jgi:hypothetical protein